MIIAPDTYRRAITASNDNANVIPLRRNRGGVFAGWLKCADCGCQVIHEKKTKPSGLEFHYWHCSNVRRMHERFDAPFSMRPRERSESGTSDVGRFASGSLAVTQEPQTGRF